VTSPAAATSPVAIAPWWVRRGLDIDADGRLRIAGVDPENLARERGTPLFVYDRARFAECARRIQAAFARTGVPFRLRFALKANPLPEVLQVFRGLGAPGTPESVGIDACSPGEVLRALECGWEPAEISYTGTNLSERDLDVVLAHGVHCNLDALSQIERYGRRAPGTRIGIRIDPGTGAGYNEHLEYSGAARPTKFGIGLERLDEALALAAAYGLAIDTVHFHAGSGWLGDGLAAFERALPAAVEAVERTRAGRHEVVEVNVGGGLGMPARSDEQPIDLDAYAAVVARHLGPLGVTIAAEPGDHLSKDAAVLLGEVVTIETRRGVTFVGLDIGWNVTCAYFIYGFAQELVLCRDAGAARTEVVTVAGHINEASDVFAEDYAMPPVREGDMVALLNAGGYLQAMSSTHCLRPMGEAVFLDRPR
jgi:diaminopimelate decarboxylase